MSKERHKIIPAVYIIFKKNDDILLSLRKNTGYMDEHYGLVSGHKDANEDLKKAAIREAKEEANVRIIPENLKLVFVQSRNAEDGERVDFYFMVNEYTGTIQNQEPDKCGDLNWFDSNNLPENIVPDIKSALKHIKKNSNYSSIFY